MSVLLIDNYDSFTYNIVELLRSLQVSKIDMLKNDQLNTDLVQQARQIIISPGPDLPDKAGSLMQLFPALSAQQKVLGVCLGHQAIAQSCGAKLKRYEHPKHGAKIQIQHFNDDALFKHIPQVHEVGLYHSWYVDEQTLPDCLLVRAKDKEGLIMAIQHKSMPWHGVQFHPESYMSAYGAQLLKNWLEL